MDAIERLFFHSVDALLPSELFSRFQKWCERAQHLSKLASSQNQQAWDQLAEHPRFADLERLDPNDDGLPTTSEEAIEALDPWLRGVLATGMKVLCLAAGGGRHAPLLVRAGGNVTVVDISERQLSLDRRGALRTNPAALCAGIHRRLK